MRARRGPSQSEDEPGVDTVEYQELSASFDDDDEAAADGEENARLLVEGGANEETTDNLNTNDTSEADLQQTVSKVQQYANVTAHVLALTLLLVVYAWICRLGGLVTPWKKSSSAGKAKLVFNWHPLLMVSAFSFMTVSSLSFRFPYNRVAVVPRRPRGVAKLVHATCWTVAALAATLGLMAVFQSHNDKQSGYIANMYSLHSWIGTAVILLYVTQFVVGVRGFGGPLANRTWSEPYRALLLRFHVAAGPLIYFLTGVTLLLGIQEKEGFIGCGYHVDSPDLFPIQHIGKIPSACLVSHALGLLIFLTMIATGLALTDFRTNA